MKVSLFKPSHIIIPQRTNSDAHEIIATQPLLDRVENYFLLLIIGPTHDYKATRLAAITALACQWSLCCWSPAR